MKRVTSAREEDIFLPSSMLHGTMERIPITAAPMPFRSSIMASSRERYIAVRTIVRMYLEEVVNRPWYPRLSFGILRNDGGRQRHLSRRSGRANEPILFKLSALSLRILALSSIVRRYFFAPDVEMAHTAAATFLLTTKRQPLVIAFKVSLSSGEKGGQVIECMRRVCTMRAPIPKDSEGNYERP